jgi:hypothetical protein
MTFNYPHPHLATRLIHPQWLSTVLPPRALLATRWAQVTLGSSLGLRDRFPGRTSLSTPTPGRAGEATYFRALSRSLCRQRAVQPSPGQPQSRI